MAEPAINEIAVKEVRPRGRGETVRTKNVHQVLKLSVQVTHDRERRASGDGELDHVRHLAESRGLAAHELLGHRAPEERRTRFGRGVGKGAGCGELAHAS